MSNHKKSHGFYRLREVLQLIPISKSSWFAGIADGRYPTAVKLGRRTSAWRAEDINDLITELGSKKDEGHYE